MAASAWAATALVYGEDFADELRSARDYLAAEQREDGRVCVCSFCEEAAWPTPLAILAWTGSSEHLEARERAVRFLLTHTGRHFPKVPNSPVVNDTSIRGWPWTLDAHSWVEPTALAIMALDVAGKGAHERVREATRTLTDRQIDSGGWNYGNTVVFGQTLHPLLDVTGMALQALAGRVPLAEVEESIALLRQGAPTARTPWTLGWSLLGLGAWGEPPEDSGSWMEETVARQDITGPFPTMDLAVLLLSQWAPNGTQERLSARTNE
jgi:hypothetical protein